MSVRFWTILLLALGFAGACSGSGKRGYESVQGSIMGSYYALTARCIGPAPAVLDSAVLALSRVDREMSTWKPDSALMRLNGLPPGETMTVSPELWYVLETAEAVRKESGGAFDVSVGALVNAWGFGPGEKGEAPSAATIESLLPALSGGYRMLPERQVTRTRDDVFIDLSAIAPGYAVDVALSVLADGGCPDALVDVSGEVRAIGNGPKGNGWRIGIESPTAIQGSIEAVLLLEDRAVATSGDYRNYREVDGQRISHTIDPRDGHPIRHGLASITVVHENTTLADAWATALNVLGPDEGLELAERKKLPVYMLVRSATGFDAVYTAPMKPLMNLP